MVGYSNDDILFIIEEYNNKIILNTDDLKKFVSEIWENNGELLAIERIEKNKIYFSIVG